MGANSPVGRIANPSKPNMTRRRGPGRIGNPSYGLAVVCLLSALSARAATPLGAQDTITVDDLRRHVSFLASDTLEGRAAGSRGGHAAAAYLLSEFRKLALDGAGEDGSFTQEFGRGYQNLLALLPGRDPLLRDECVIVCGHFDHVGYGNASNSNGPYGQIHNGADDNASGTSAVLEVAQAFSQLDEPPRRSVLFALWDAEEAGLLGSVHWTRNPTRPLDSLRLVINVDMIGRLRNERLIVYGVRTMPGLRQLVSRANLGSDLSLDFDWSNRDDSDHWPFFQRRVPYLMLHTGDHPDYHRPSDDADKLNLSGLEHVTRLMFQSALAAADAPTIAKFRPASFREGPRAQKAARGAPRHRTPRFGIVWDDHRESGAPFVVTRVSPDSPAEAAGLQPGDRLVRFNGTEAAGIDHLARRVLAADTDVDVVVERPGESAPLPLHVQLRGSRLRLGITWRDDPAEPGVAIVTRVVPHSPAADADLRPLDRILPVDTEPETNSEWLRKAVAEAVDELNVLVERGGRVRPVTVALFPSQRP